MPNQPLRFVIDNLGWLLGSLLLAVLIWYAAVSANDPVEQRRFPVPVAIEYKMAEGIVVANKSATTAQVTIRALRSVLNEIEQRNISVVADLTALTPRPEAYGVTLVGKLIDTRSGSVVGIVPARVNVELVRRAEQLKTLAVRFVQEPPVGFTASAIPAQPTVLVSGAESKVAQVREVQARLNLADQRTSFIRTVPLIAVDAENRAVPDVTLTPAEMTITVDIQQRADVTELTVEPLIVGSLPPGYLRLNQNWEPRRIVVRGDQLAIEQLGGVIRTEPIDLTGHTETFTQTVRLALPPGVVMPDPKDVTVTIEIEPVLGSREFANIAVQTQGLDPADYDITVRPDRVNVIVRGPQIVVERLTAKDISVFAPLNGLPVGTHQITLQASVAKAGIDSDDVVIPNAQATVTIVARRPTITPTTGPTATPTPRAVTPTPEATP